VPTHYAFEVTCIYHLAHASSSLNLWLEHLLVSLKSPC
jgi:hypothetical protein